MDLCRLDKFVLEKISKYRMPGLAIGLLKGEEVVYARGFGFRDLEQSLPQTPSTNHCIGSVTKSFTALAVMQLYERGKLSPDDPVNKYVDVIKSPDIKIHHLLTHTSGIPALAYAEALINSYYSSRGLWLPVSSPDHVSTYMSDYTSWIQFKPGERWFYLNEGYALLGKIVEKVSGVKYEEYVKSNLLEKLEMNKSYFGRDEYLRDSDKATPYYLSPEGKLARAEPIFTITSDGGLFSNILDLLKYASMFIGRGSYKGAQIVEPSLVELMERPHVKLPYESPISRYYGYGLTAHDDFHGKKLVNHSGSVLVYTAFLGYIPSEKVAVAILANSSGYPLSFIGAYALTLALGLDPDRELGFIKQDEILDKLEGIYTGYKNSMAFKLKKAGGSLIVEDLVRKTQLPIFPAKVQDDYALFYLYNIGVKV
ncbi:MAG: serine hydrolase domain-containing protein, partial [Desulfurococcaceae archaeon]